MHHAEIHFVIYLYDNTAHSIRPKLQHMIALKGLHA